jgi:hypothetical protein
MLFVYGNIHWALRDHCDILQVTAHAVSRLQHGREIGVFSTIVDLRPAFDLVLARDFLVRSHVRVLSRTVEIVEYQLQSENVEEQ